MAFLVALEILIPTHIKRAWQARRNRVSGAFFVTVMAILVLTGCGLYYCGDEQWRNTASGIHLMLGLASPVLLVCTSGWDAKVEQGARLCAQHQPQWIVRFSA